MEHHRPCATSLSVRPMSSDAMYTAQAYRDEQDGEKPDEALPVASVP